MNTGGTVRKIFELARLRHIFDLRSRREEGSEVGCFSHPFSNGKLSLLSFEITGRAYYRYGHTQFGRFGGL